MKRYPEKKRKLRTSDFTKYVIVVPTKAARKELMEAFEHIHNSDIDTNFVAVNQLAHEYLDDSRVDGAYNHIVVNRNLYEEISKQVNA